MISSKDVIRMKIPYPTISDKLAVAVHMYICKEKSNSHCEFIKCQTLKPYMLSSSLINHYIDESADISRNPFLRTTRIDCDKLFITDLVKYDIKMRTTLRPDVSSELFDDVIAELSEDGYSAISLNESELMCINFLITNA